jgi:hypothetical protein
MQRSQANLELIEAWYSTTNEGHVVTQLVQSLLVFIVFPKEKSYYERLNSIGINQFEKRGWPRPVQIIGATNSLGQLLRHMRNAVAHGLVVFHGTGPEGADARNLDEIFIEFSDKVPGENNPIHWQVAIAGNDLKDFMFMIMREANDD